MPARHAPAVGDTGAICLAFPRWRRFVELAAAVAVHALRRCLRPVDPCRVTLSRLALGFSVRTYEIQKEKSHEIEKVIVLTAVWVPSCSAVSCASRFRHARRRTGHHMRQRLDRRHAGGRYYLLEAPKIFHRAGARRRRRSWAGGGRDVPGHRSVRHSGDGALGVRWRPERGVEVALVLCLCVHHERRIRGPFENERTEVRGFESCTAPAGW
eukprot:SAG31_NODE_921_length_10984_cov_2.779329_7_plen_212_part_00